MNILKYFRLTDVGPFQDVKFAPKPGLSVIYGLNQVSKSSTNGNAAGKSYLTASPADILYEEPIIGTKRDKVKSGKRTLAFTNYKGQDVKVIREAKGKSESLRFQVDGKVLEPRKLSDQKDLLKKLWPISADEYNTYGHLDARKPHPLVMGSPAERKAFFTSFFNINKLDAERKILAAEMNSLKKIKASFAELRNVYDSQSKDLLDEDTEADLRSRLKKLSKKHKRLVEEQKENSNLQRFDSFFASVGKDFPKFLSYFEQEIPDIDEYHRLLKIAKKEVQEDEERHEHAKKYSEYLNGNKAFENAIRKLSDKAARFLVACGSLERALKETSKGERLHRKYLNEFNTLKAEYEKRQKVNRPKKVQKPEGNEGDLETLRRAFAHQLKHATKFKEGRCEHCGSIVKVKDPKKLQKKIDEIDEQLDQWQAYRTYKQKKKDYKENYKRRCELEELMLDAANKHDKYEVLAKFHSELINVPEEPKPYKGKKFLVEDTLKAIQMSKDKVALFQRYKHAIPIMQEFASLPKEVQMEISKRKGKSDALDFSQIDKVQQKISKIEAKLRLHETVKERCTEIEERLSKLKKKLKNEKYLKTLLEGYSDKVIKKMVIEAISTKLMALVNQYARIVFPEDYKFTFDWSGSDISLKVHRRYGKRVDVSDVRKLSGAESKLFTIVLVLALLSFVPKRKRLSFLVMDEPTANFSRETSEAFTKLLPYLNKVIPTLIIVTPDSEERYEGAHEYTVVKVDGKAALVEGHPSSLKGVNK